MPTPRTRRGQQGEALARQYLEEQGCRILAANYRSPWGEVDLVAQEGEVVVFVEVRTRRSLAYGTPEESVTAAKSQRLVATAQHYLAAQGLAAAAWRIDLVGIRLGPPGQSPQLNHLRHAVQL